MLELVFYNWKRTDDKLAKERSAMEENNKKFNAALNKCRHSRAVYTALGAFIKPRIQQADDVLKKRQIIVGEVLPLLNEPKGNQQAI